MADIINGKFAVRVVEVNNKNLHGAYKEGMKYCKSVMMGRAVRLKARAGKTYEGRIGVIRCVATGGFGAKPEFVFLVSICKKGTKPADRDFLESPTWQNRSYWGIQDLEVLDEQLKENTDGKV